MFRFMSKFDPVITLRQTADFIVGESIKRVPQDFRDAYPEIPWRKIAGMRDVISHAYEDLAYEVLWDAVEINFPVFLSDLERIIADF